MTWSARRSPMHASRATGPASTIVIDHVVDADLEDAHAVGSYQLMFAVSGRRWLPAGSRRVDYPLTSSHVVNASAAARTARRSSWALPSWDPRPAVRSSVISFASSRG